MENTWEKFKKQQVSEDAGVLFPVVDATFDRLPKLQKEQFRLIIVVAPGVPVETEMLANLWNTVCMGEPDGAALTHGVTLWPSFP